LSLCSPTSPCRLWTIALAEAAAALVEFEELIKSLIVLAHVVHVGETSSRIAGVRWWCTSRAPSDIPRITCTAPAAHLHRSRGRAAVNDFAVLPSYRGIAMHHALSVYDAYPQA
jgi:hypothetical protein